MSTALRMDEVKVGDRLRLPDDIAGDHRVLTVTDLTERGFHYRFDEAMTIVPRWGMTMAAEGHEHFGLDGMCIFEREEAGL